MEICRCWQWYAFSVELYNLELKSLLLVFFPIDFDFRINSRVSMSLPFNLFPKEPHIGSFINILEYRCHVFVVCSVMFILEFAFSFSYISFMNSKPCLWDDPRLICCIWRSRPWRCLTSGVHSGLMWDLIFAKGKNIVFSTLLCRSKNLSYSKKNLKSARGAPEVVEQKLAKYVTLAKMSGPFELFCTLPFPTLRISPVGLVPKKDGDVPTFLSTV